MVRMQPELENFLNSKNLKPFIYQKEVWQAIDDGYSGMINAPTGTGKTYAAWLGILNKYLKAGNKQGLKVLWISPLRALTNDIQKALQQSADDLGLNWSVESRTGDTPSAQKQKQKTKMPDCLITTPESMHVLFTTQDYPKLFENLDFIVVDEWHELLGTKRGVQTELVISRLEAINPEVKIWGVSATIGNLEEALEVLTFSLDDKSKRKIVSAKLKKEIEVEIIMPEKVESFSWAGHLGIALLEKVIPIIKENNTTLLFTNTRSQTELWYQNITAAYPELENEIAVYHGSIEKKVRHEIEERINNYELKAVICTSSLDLGVDFRPVENVIQIGSPKGVARFMQRAGRSGHSPGEISKIYFLPTHSLEIIEGVALKKCVAENKIEGREPITRPFDVLVQYLVTLAISEGYTKEQIFNELTSTFAYHDLSLQELEWALDFVTKGGKTLGSYDQFTKVDIKDGVYKVEKQFIKRLHMLSIGTITSEPVVTIQYMKGRILGTIEENYLSAINPGDTFWFAGRPLKLIRIRNMTAFVKRSESKKGIVPRWYGGRIPLSSFLADTLRREIYTAKNSKTPELRQLSDLLKIQERRSKVPSPEEFLIEKTRTNEGHHMFFYPLEGRQVHEGMAAVIAYRLSLIEPITFSIAMNDYGFELLSSTEIKIEELTEQIFSLENLTTDLIESMNSSEMTKRRFRQIAEIAGLIFPGYPGQRVRDKHLMASASLLYEVFSKYDEGNLLMKQAFEEVLNYNLNKDRLQRAFERINKQKIIIKEAKYLSPFAFPIYVDSLREKLSSEQIENKIKRMKLEVED